MPDVNPSHCYAADIGERRSGWLADQQCAGRKENPKPEFEPEGLELNLIERTPRGQCAQSFGSEAASSVFSTASQALGA
jgi:hypothetical protein